MITIKFKTNEQKEFDLDSLDMVNFNENQLHAAILNGLSLYKSSFVKANLRSAELSRCYLGEAIFVGALLMNANLTYSVLTSANFSFSKLAGANFFKADMRNANLSYTDIFSTEFKGADLRGTNFFGAERIESAIFNEALYDKNTIWPEDFYPRPSGLIFIE